jgi:Tol biopolymer transport system component
MRLSDIAMARIELHEATTGRPEDAATTGAVSRSGTSRLIPYVAAVLLATVTGVSVWWLTRPADPSRPQVRLALDLPEDQRFTIFNRGVVAISPDGSRVAYAANQRLYLRAMDQASATPIPGTEAPLVQNAPRSPFFSPDGQWVAFYQEGQLKKVSVNGGAPIAIGEVPNYIGASWGSDDRILLGGGSAGDGIFEIAAGGGAAERLIASDDRPTQPAALPGGDWILYTISPIGSTMGNAVIHSRATGETRELLNGVEDARYIQSGHLVFMRANALFAQVFDVATLTLQGQPVQILDGVASATGIDLAHADVSASGTLVFIGTNPERSLTNSLVHVTRDGKRAVLATMSGLAWYPRYSPDGTRIAFGQSEIADLNGPSDLWMLHADGHTWTATPFVGTPFDERGAIFSPNGRWVAYVSNKSGTNDIYARPFPGPGAEVTISVGGGGEPVWGPSGRELFYRRDRKLMAVRIEERGGSLVVSAPALVFDDPYRPDTFGTQGGVVLEQGAVANYDVAPDGTRFVMVDEPQELADTQFTRIEVIRKLLRSTQAHLDLPFIPGASTIGRQVEAVHPMVPIHDAVDLSTLRRPFHHDADFGSVHFDRTGASIDLFSQEGLGDIQEFDDPGLSTRVIVTEADAQGGSSVRIL